MNPLLQTHFDTALEHPNGIKKLRELILTLAMQGKLVGQDPNDQPASELLKEIQVEKARLVAEGKVKKSESLPPIKEEEKAFAIPKGWEWVRLGEISLYNGRPNIESKKISKESWILELEDIEKETSRLIQKVRYSERETKSTKSSFKKGDILYGKLRPYLDKVIVADEDGYCTTEIVPIVPFQKIHSEFLRKLLKRPSFLQYVTEISYGVKMPRLGTPDAVLSVHPLPPLAEQKRIVTKIDELFALCDQLEALKKQKEAKRKDLHQSVLTQLLEAESHADFQRHFQFLTTHFHELYSVKENVQELRKAVLQLAVMGKLVPQNEKDQPASVLLKEIQVEKARLVAEGKIKKSEALPAIKEEEKPFTIPKGWEWVRLGDLTSLITKGSSPNWQGVNYTDARTGILFITSENVYNYSLKLSNKKYVEAKFNEIEPRSILQKYDILMNLVGASIGRVAYYNLDELANINQAVCLIRLLDKDRFIDFNFLLHFLNSDICIGYMFDKQVDNARANLSMGNVNKFPIPLPPLAEQKRIVEKVDELLELCDALEEGIGKAEEKREEILEGMVRG